MDIDLSRMPFGPAAGMVKTLEDVREACKGSSTHIVIGSITDDRRAGNSGQREVEISAGVYLNSIGLENKGLLAATEISSLPEILRIGKRAGKTIVPSVAGFNRHQYSVLLGTVASLGFRHVELNFGCPNVLDDGKQKPILSFDTKALDELLRYLIPSAGRGITLYLKLSPYSDPFQLKAVARVIARHAVDAHTFDTSLVVVTSNTFPNCLAFTEDGAPVINARTSDGTSVIFGGGSGSSLFRAIAVGQVRQFVDAFRELEVTVPVIGVGGIDSAKAAREHLRAGAIGFQVGSHVRMYGVRAIDEIAMGLA